MTAAARAAPSTGRRLRTISSYDELIAGIRQRIDELGISHAVLEELSGLTSGHFGKMVGASRVKIMGMQSLFLILETLAVRLVIEESPELLSRMSTRYEQRVEWTRRTGVIRKSISPEVRAAVVHEHMVELGRRGGRGRSPCVAARMAQNAARSRWSKARNGRG